MLVITPRVIATSFALTSFAAAVVVGLWANNPFETIVARALLTMVCCYAIGRLIGGLADRAVQQHVDKYKQDHPYTLDVVTSEPQPADAPPRVGKRPRTT